MVLRRLALAGAIVSAVLFLVGGAASAARGYPDGSGDVKGGSGPDIALLTVSNSTFRYALTGQ